MPMLFRFAMRLYKGLIGQWDEGFHGHWDQAIRNSSCVRAAILRALKVEVGFLEGFDSLAFLWDIASFYDSIRLCDLVRMDLERHFPPGFFDFQSLGTAAREPSRNANLLALGSR